VWLQANSATTATPTKGVLLLRRVAAACCLLQVLATTCVVSAAIIAGMKEKAEAFAKQEAEKALQGRGASNGAAAASSNGAAGCGEGGSGRPSSGGGAAAKKVCWRGACCGHTGTAAMMAVGLRLWPADGCRGTRHRSHADTSMLALRPVLAA
jgi:hypothetical protein